MKNFNGNQIYNDFAKSLIGQGDVKINYNNEKLTIGNLTFDALSDNEGNGKGKIYCCRLPDGMMLSDEAYDGKMFRTSSAKLKGTIADIVYDRFDDYMSFSPRIIMSNGLSIFVVSDEEFNDMGALILSKAPASVKCVGLPRC